MCEHKVTSIHRLFGTHRGCKLHNSTSYRNLYPQRCTCRTSGSVQPHSHFLSLCTPLPNQNEEIQLGKIQQDFFSTKVTEDECVRNSTRVLRYQYCVLRYQYCVLRFSTVC